MKVYDYCHVMLSIFILSVKLLFINFKYLNFKCSQLISYDVNDESKTDEPMMKNLKK